MKFKKLSIKRKSILEKADQIIKDHDDSVRYKDQCEKANICHKCGEEMVLIETERGKYGGTKRFACPKHSSVVYEHNWYHGPY